jgi:hypothetical protein
LYLCKKFSGNEFYSEVQYKQAVKPFRSAEEKGSDAGLFVGTGAKRLPALYF